MANSLLRAAAERHRKVASTLSNPSDRAIIHQYAHELEDLERLEVKPSMEFANDNIESKRFMLADALSKLYRPDATTVFDELLNDLEGR